MSGVADVARSRSGHLDFTNFDPGVCDCGAPATATGMCVACFCSGVRTVDMTPPRPSRRRRPTSQYPLVGRGCTYRT